MAYKAKRLLYTIQNEIAIMNIGFVCNTHYFLVYQRVVSRFHRGAYKEK